MWSVMNPPSVGICAIVKLLSDFNKLPFHFHSQITCKLRFYVDCVCLVQISYKLIEIITWLETFYIMHTVM